MHLPCPARRPLSRVTTALTLAAATALLPGLTAHADDFKRLDPNGGHWGQGGIYHCHIDGCIPTVNRNQYRSRALNRNDYNLYYLEDDWPDRIAIQGCKTARTVVLENTSRAPVTWTNPRQCEIREGLWIDEYTGEEFTRAAQMEVDHIIPPIYANASNGYQWDDGKRAQFTNDPLNLIPVSRETSRKRRDRSIGEWQPREEFECEYAIAWQALANTYDLDLFSRDASRIKQIQERCGDNLGDGVEED